MSLPLTRRIARAALLVAAGAAAGVGAAGSASATPELPAAQDLGGLTVVDGTAGSAVDDVTKDVTRTVGDADKAAPATGRTARKAAGSLAKDAPVKGLPVV